MIGRSTPTWPSEGEEEDQAAQLEALADGDKPTLLFVYVLLILVNSLRLIIDFQLVRSSFRLDQSPSRSVHFQPFQQLRSSSQDTFPSRRPRLARRLVGQVPMVWVTGKCAGWNSGRQAERSHRCWRCIWLSYGDDSADVS